MKLVVVRLQCCLYIGTTMMWVEGGEGGGVPADSISSCDLVRRNRLYTARSPILTRSV